MFETRHKMLVRDKRTCPEGTDVERRAGHSLFEGGALWVETPEQIVREEACPRGPSWRGPHNARLGRLGFFESSQIGPHYLQQ